MIYVFDVESRELEKDIAYYQSCLEAILQNSPDAKIFCLIHKMDLVQEDQRDAIFKDREEDLKRLSKVGVAERAFPLNKPSNLAICVCALSCDSGR